MKIRLLFCFTALIAAASLAAERPPLLAPGTAAPDFTAPKRSSTGG